MTKQVAIVSLGLLLLSGCPVNPPSSAGDSSLANTNAGTWDDGKSRTAPARPNDFNTDPNRAVASVKGAAITLGQISKPMFEAYGLNFMLHLVRLEYYGQKAREEGIVVTAEDVEAERMRTIENMFKDSNLLDKFKGDEPEQVNARRAEMLRLLPQILKAQKITIAEFELGMQANAILWKVAAAQIQKEINDDSLREAFNIKFGAKVRVQHIQVANVRDALTAIRRIESGETFESVVKAMSLDAKSRPFGGELRPFTRAEREVPTSFKDVAFALKAGEVSSPVETGSYVEVIKTIEHIPPQFVKFEDHKEALREELTGLMVNLRIGNLRRSYDADAIRATTILDPILEHQYRRMTGQEGSEPDAKTMRKNISASDQANMPANSGTGPEVARPPATRPGN